MKKTFRKPYKIQRKKSVLKNRFFWLPVLILIIGGGIFYLICFSSFFQIKEIKISGEQKVSIEDARKLIEKEIEQRISFFSTRSIFLANLNEINKILLEKFPQIDKVNLKKKFPHSLTVIIKERKPAAVFIHNEDHFFVDEKGVIFEEVVEIDPMMFKIENLTLKQELKLGEKVVKEEQILRIFEIKSKLEENLKILAIKASIISEERLNVKTLKNWQIYFSLKEDIPSQILNLSLVLEEKIPPEKRENLEYIDLRFGTRVFYRYQD